MTPDQQQIRELEKQLRRVGEEKETLKKSTPLSITEIPSARLVRSIPVKQGLTGR